MRNHRRVFVAAVAALAGLAAPAYAQKAINHSKARAGGVTPGDAPGYPVTISVSGSYKLTGNLRIPNADTHGIHVTADDVTIDLNGFAVIGPGPDPNETFGSGACVRSEPRRNIVVINGSVSGMEVGIHLLGHSHRVEKVSAQANEFGMLVDGNSTIVGNTVAFNQRLGISSQGVITGNSVMLNEGHGISATGGTVVNNSVTNNIGFGLLLSGAGYAHNVMSGNNGGGAEVSGGIQMGAGTNICDGVPCP